MIRIQVFSTMMSRLDVLASHFTASPSWAKHVIFSPEVKEALKSGKPVVALESTIISHGMPFPQNLETALQVEKVARDNGAVPATIAILHGQVRVGLNSDDLRLLAEQGPKCHKCSRRDLAAIVANKAHGATTVAATMYIANLVGIRVFATGGIGGVHRGAEETFDVSADLTELGRTPVAVVCAGVKSILDIPKTLEYLETQGVSVMTLGSKHFPAFFTADSGVDSPATVQSELDCAKIIAANGELSLDSGLIIAVPIPKQQEAEAKVVEDATVQALQEMKQANVQGRDVTPFLLSRVNQLTSGHSLTSNIALIKNNVAVGSRIAAHLAKLSSK